MKGFFAARNYPGDVIQNAFEKATNTTRTTALATRDKDTNEDRPILALTFHPQNLQVKNVILRNFGIVQEDPFLKAVFAKPPLVAYRRDKNIGEVVVRAAFREKRSNSQPSVPGNQPCGKPGCPTCPFLDTNTTFMGPEGDFNVRGQFNCNSSDVVYVLSCYRCNLLYVGETYRTVRERFKEHERSARLKYKNPIGEHFGSNHEISTDLRIAVVWKNSKNGQYRKFMESRIIASLGCLQPLGLNSRELKSLGSKIFPYKRLRIAVSFIF